MVFKSSRIAVPIIALAALLALPGAAGSAAQPLVSSPPNIVVVMLDDIAFLDHRIWDRLPNIKSLFIDHGIEALNYWGNDPLCCPGRANFLTGQVAHVNGVVRNDGRLLDPTETIATELDGLGYYTSVCGKYLNLTPRLNDKTPPGWDNAVISAGGYYNYKAWVNDVLESHGPGPADYSTDVFADHCLDFLAAAPDDAPIFQFMTPFAPHKGGDATGVVDAWEPVPAPRHLNDARCTGIPPWKPANYNPADLTGKPGYVRRRPLLQGVFSVGYPLEKRCRALLSVDDWLGRVVGLLSAQGRYANTIFVLTADNGMGYGAFRWPRKGSPHVAELPFFISWPSVLTGPSRQITKLLTNVDLAPTLCEFAGCEMGPYPNGEPADGQSFAGLIAPARSHSVPQRRAIILEERGSGEAPRWRGIMTDPADHPSGKQWYYIEYATGERELYNLTDQPCYAWQAGMSGDPCMLNNLAKKRPGLRRDLHAELGALW